MEILELHHLTKRFGACDAVTDLSFSVPEHSTFGFIGKNGAGKTTTMKMILGFLPPTAGKVIVSGEKVTYGDTRTNRHIGYLPDVPEFYGYMNPREYLRFCGRMAEMAPAKTASRTSELLQLVGLGDVKRRIHGFSRGMKQRLGIAQALLNEPRLLICDEPTSALDPIGRKEILDILAAIRGQTTVVFSTHVLSDVERICDRIAVLDQGKLVLQGDLTSIKHTYRRDALLVETIYLDGAARLASRARELPACLAATVAGNSVTIRFVGNSEPGRPILEIILAEQIPISRYQLLEPSLEDVFLELMK